MLIKIAGSQKQHPVFATVGKELLGKMRKTVVSFLLPGNAQGDPLAVKPEMLRRVLLGSVFWTKLIMDHILRGLQEGYVDSR